MFRVNQLIGFGVGGAGGSLGGVISVSSYIGDMTGDGGLAAAFNGTTNSALTSCATKGSAILGYAGADFSSSPKRIFKVEVHGSNNQGYVNGANPVLNIGLFAKTGSAPSNATDGTLLGSLSPTDTANESAARTITSSDNLTLWNYVWIYLAQGGSAATIAIAEITLYESV